MQHLLEVLDRLRPVKVALLGDFMLDRYVYGDTERISPEAPVPILRVVGRDDRAGGSGSVALDVLALGGGVRCIGTLGRDAVGVELLSILEQAGADVSGMVRLEGRPTTLKQRLVGLAQHRHRQQILRMDEECTAPPDAAACAALRDAVAVALKDCQVLAIEDYGKGVLDERLTPELIAMARKAGVAVLVDPYRVRDYSRYRGATCLTPNRYEAQLAAGVTITDEKSLALCAEKIMESAGADSVVITLDREGAYLARRGSGGVRVPTRERTVYDVAGAGDAVLAMLAVALAGGAEMHDAVALANVAGGLEVERFGVVPITRQEVADELRRMVGLRGGKVMTRPALAAEVARRRGLGQRVVFTNGCFDLLHMGHVRYLRQARELGSCLIVAINSDDSVRRLKGANRPVIGQDERAEMLGSLECVDYVTVFDEDTPIPLLDLLRPDILVKGGSTGAIVGQELVESYGGQVAKMELVAGLSTTEIINRILDGKRNG